MRYLLNGLMALSAIVALLMIGNLLYGLMTDGFSNGGGMAILAFQLFGAIASVVTLLLGGLSFAIGRKSEDATQGIPKAGMVIGALGLVVLGAMVMF